MRNAPREPRELRKRVGGLRTMAVTGIEPRAAHPIIRPDLWATPGLVMSHDFLAVLRSPSSWRAGAESLANRYGARCGSP
jgi:hypothetical protein